MAGNLNGIRSHIHPIEARELTNRESARLHGFTDDFVFSGNHAAMGVQIANSVPIPLATCLARQIAMALDGRCSGKSEGFKDHGARLTEKKFAGEKAMR